MLRISFQVTFGIALCTLLSCALPQDRRSSQRFVATPELRAVKAYQEGLSLAGRSRYVDADFKFRESLYFAPGQRNARFNLAMVLEQLGSFPEALVLLDQLAKESAPRNDPLTPAEIAFARGKVLTAEGKFRPAAEAFEQALALARADPKAEWGLIARSLSALSFRLGDEDQALCYLRLSKAALPQAAEVLRRAKILVGMQRLDDAQLEMSEYFSAHRGDRDPQLLHSMAMIELAKGDAHSALERARQALDSFGPGAPFENENLLVRTLARRRLESLGEIVKDEPTKKGRKARRASRVQAKPTASSLPPDARAASKDAESSDEQENKDSDSPQDDPVQMLALLTQLSESNAQLYWPLEMIEGERALRAELEAQVAATAE